MAYRTFKRVLGETSLERKCRFLFGASLLLLIVGGFSLFSDQTKGLISENTRSNCRYLVDALLMKVHFEKDDEFVAAATLPVGQHQELAKDISSNIGSLRYSGKFLSLDPTDSTAVSRPESREEELLLMRLRDEYEAQLAELAKVPRPRKTEPNTVGDAPDEQAEETTAIYETYRDLPPKEADVLSASGDEYFYYQAVQWKTSCVACHLTIYGISPQVADGQTPSYEEMALALPFRAVKVELPYRITRRGINRIYSILLATGIITVFLSMIALYIVVRYVIVKPLQHLQHVSEEVERGNYGARAQIETNDEFEQLAESFNRMLGHLVDAQDQLQAANTSLDAKVDQLAQANMQLYESNRLKSNFLANVSHELRTPLNSIIGFSDVLQGIDALNDKQKRYVSNISNSGRVLLDMINDILDLAKMESGKMDVRGTTFSVAALVKAQCDLVAGLAEEKNIDLTVDAPDDLPEIFQDQPKVQQILTNLISNAIKFTPEGGRIRIIVEAEPPEQPPLPGADGRRYGSGHRGRGPRGHF